MTRFSAHEPATSSLLVDDDAVRVTRWDFAPGAETGWHRHGLAYVVVALTDCPFLVVSEAGEQRVDVPAGTAYSRDAGIEHNVVNGGERPMSFVEIELKR
ncbi:cupin domain-containing protein [Prosthecomicrobium sp. N25]|uniref:cupin domain-containing protein n=1 Tax=Prosthecomicrobium sp. N25 TaxID=3129254 RepID=UPI0030776002